MYDFRDFPEIDYSGYFRVSYHFSDFSSKMTIPTWKWKFWNLSEFSLTLYTVYSSILDGRGRPENPDVAHKHLLHTDKLRRVKQMFAMQVLIQQQEEEIAEVKAIKGFKKKVKTIIWIS